jgi:hypothetical protein
VAAPWQYDVKASWRTARWKRASLSKTIMLDINVTLFTLPILGHLGDFGHGSDLAPTEGPWSTMVRLSKWASGVKKDEQKKLIRRIIRNRKSAPFLFSGEIVRGKTQMSFLSEV